MGLEEHKYGEWLESEKCIQGMHTKYKYMEVQVGVGKYTNTKVHNFYLLYRYDHLMS